MAQARFSLQLNAFAKLPGVSRILVLHGASSPQLEALREISDKVRLVQMSSWFSGRGTVQMLDSCETKFLALVLPGQFSVEIEWENLERFGDVAEDTGAGIVYSDLRDGRANDLIEYPLADYQLGSVSETFDFGAMVVVSKRAAESALKKYGQVEPSLSWAGFYDLRLKIAAGFPVVRIPEPLYTRRTFAQTTPQTSTAGDVDKYLGPKNREYHLEMEQVLTAHLRRIGAFLEPRFSTPPAPEGEFPVTASVIIPVRNREKTIAGAVHSALKQVAPFDYNIIVIDDHSTDGTQEILRRLAGQHRNLIHKIPRRTNLGVGGLWNEAIYSPECGLYAVQLDSDDLYDGTQVLQRLVAEFYPSSPDPCAEARALAVPRYAMVVGSYTTVNFNLEEVPPGLVDHKEWTRENGRNNALRMTGLGAPRAFYVPVLRRFGLPDISNGEDYAVSLRISREYEVGRCLESLYLARRWDENSDRTLPLATVKGAEFKKIVSMLSVNRPDFLQQIWPVVLTLISATKNRYETYTDWLRTGEIRARQNLRSAPAAREEIANG
jgi:glycosyltransferase involved in cell wall biosynthesis